MIFPSELRYTADHEWVQLKDGQALIGITAFAQAELGDIVFVDIPLMDAEINQNEVFGSVEAVKTVSDLFMPITGKIVAVNTDLDQDPGLVNSDPYEAGWLALVSLSNPGEFENLLSAEQYQALIGR